MMNASGALNFQTLKLSADRAEFRGLCETLASIVNQHGIECTAYLSKELPRFSILDDEARAGAIRSLSAYVRLCQDVMAQEGSLTSSPTFVWRAIRDAGLIPPSDLFSKILDTDVIEIYDLNNVQTFRNFNFFKFSSYTLEDLYSMPWPKLFERVDATITNQILALLTKLTSSRSRKIVSTGIGSQIIEEVSSTRKYHLNVDVKYLGLLYDRTDSAAAFIGIEHATILRRSDHPAQAAVDLV